MIQKKKHDDRSNDCRDWTTRKLIETAEACYSAIYQAECYGMSDLRGFHFTMEELERRGYEMVERMDMSIRKKR